MSANADATVTTVLGNGDSVASQLVCPYIADVEFASRLEITSETTAVVSIAGIDVSFNLVVDLKSAFDCSGWGIDKSAANGNTHEQELISALVVSLSGEVLNGFLHSDISANLLGYLRDQYDQAFHAAFPEYVSMNTKTGADAAADEDGIAATNGAGQSAAGSDAYTLAQSAAGSSTVTQSATVSAYDFDIDVSAGEAAAAFTDNLTEAHLNSLFMQLPIPQIIGATDANGNPSSRALPLLAGDRITFVLDVTVSANSGNTSNAAMNPDGTNAPAANDNAGLTTIMPGTTSANNNGVSISLGTRRVAFVLTQSE
jgi:hypothetical protein